MNTRLPFLLFGVLLAMLWGLGLMLAYKRTAVDQALAVPSLNVPDVSISAVHVKSKREGKGFDAQLVKLGDDWFLKKDNQSAKVEGFRVDSLIRQIKDAKRNHDADTTGSLSTYGLDAPDTIVTLSGKVGIIEKEWTFNVGKESPDKIFIYVSSSDDPKKAIGVARSSLDTVLFANPSHLRSKRLFETLDTQVQKIVVKNAGTELALEKSEDQAWKFVTPPLGFADYERPAPEKTPDAKAAESGVKGVLKAALSLAVESEADFLPLGDRLSAYGLENGKEQMRIEVSRKPSKAGAEAPKETILIGSAVPGKDQVYGRSAGDDGVFRLEKNLLKVLVESTADPRAIRSRDVGFFDPKIVDYISIRKGKNETKLFKGAGPGGLWHIQTAGDKIRKADEKVVQQFLESAGGKRAIVRFFDGTEADAKLDAGRGLDDPAHEIVIYANGVDPKSSGAGPLPTSIPDLIKDAKPTLRLAVGKVDGEAVYARRDLAEGIVNRVQLAKSSVDQMTLDADVSRFFDLSLPEFDAAGVTSIYRNRSGDKETIERIGAEWKIRDASAPTGFKPAEQPKVNQLLQVISGLKTRRWAKKLGKDEDWGKFGLKTPATVLTFTTRGTSLSSTALASVVAQLTGAGPWSAAAAQAVLRDQEKISVWIAKDLTEDRTGYYAWQSNVDCLFVLPADFVQFAQSVDFRDQSQARVTGPALAASLVAQTADAGPSLFNVLSPLGTLQIQHFDPARATELHVSVRTREELRKFAFQRSPNGTWTDKSGLLEFHLDSDRVEQLVKNLANFHAQRASALSGGPRTDHQVSPKDAVLTLETKLQDGHTVTLFIGARFEALGFFALSSQTPDAVSIVRFDVVEPLLRGVSYFGKDRTASAN